MRGGHWRKSTSDREGKLFRSYDVASGTILRIGSQGFQRSSKIFFLFGKAASKCINQRRFDIKYIGLQKNIHLETQSL
jgi:hypothetical protein